MLGEKKGFCFFLRRAIFVLMVLSVAVFLLLSPKKQEENMGEESCPLFDAFSSCLGKTMEQVIGILGEPKDVIYVSPQPSSAPSFLSKTKKEDYCQIAEDFYSQKLLLTLVYVVDREKIYIVFSPETTKVQSVIYRGYKDPVPFDRIFQEISN